MPIAGLSRVFKAWCGSDKNMVIMPGSVPTCLHHLLMLLLGASACGCRFCVPGTVGNKVLAGQKRIELDRSTVLDVQCQIVSSSAGSAEVDRGPV